MGSTTVNTASITPEANKLYLLSVVSRTNTSTNPNQPSVTGAGLTWEAIGSVVYDNTSSSRRRLTLFRAMGSNPTSGALTISFNEQTQTDFSWAVEKVSGMDTSGTNGSGAIVQSATNYDAGVSSSLSVSLNTFADENNATFGAFATGDGLVTSSAGSGFTKLGDAADPNNGVRVTNEWKNENDTSVDMSWSGASHLGGVAIEINAAEATSSEELEVTNVTSGASSTAGSSVNTSSITPEANKLYLLSVASRTGISANPDQPTISGAGLTWDAIGSVVYDNTSSSRRRVTLFRAMGANPSSGALTISFNGQTQTDFGWSLEKVSGADTSGTNGSGAIVQNATNFDQEDGGLSSSLTITLNAFGNENNATFGAFATGDGLLTSTSGSGFTKLGDIADPNNGLRLTDEWKNSNDISVDMSWSNVSQLGGVAVELKAAQSSVSTYSDNKTFDYDLLGRLLSFTTEVFGESDYTYDDVGNMLTGDVFNQASTYSYNNDNQLTQKGSTSFSYDNKGNQTARGSTTLGYDFDNRLTSFAKSGSSTIAFEYDGKGDRLSEKVGETTTREFVNDVSGDLTQVLIEKDVQSGTDNYFLYGQGLISQGLVGAQNRQYYLEDGVGNVRVLTNSSGDAIDHYIYDAYGNQVGEEITANFKFKGEQQDTETGLYYMRARYYDPTTARFISKDPVEGKLNNPLSQNGYNYVHGNPINASDPSGEEYLNLNLSAGVGVGISCGVLISEQGYYPYISGGAVAGVSVSATASTSDPSSGWSSSLSGTSGIPQLFFLSGGVNVDHKTNEPSFEVGLGFPPGVQLTTGYTFGPF